MFNALINLMLTKVLSPVRHLLIVKIKCLDHCAALELLCRVKEVPFKLLVS